MGRDEQPDRLLLGGEQLPLVELLIGNGRVDRAGEPRAAGDGGRSRAVRRRRAAGGAAIGRRVGGEIEDRALADERILLRLLAGGLGTLEDFQHALARRPGGAERAALDGHDLLDELAERLERQIDDLQQELVEIDATLADLQKLKTVFKKDGTVTAGNASGINDAAAAVVLMEKAAAQKQGAKPLARLVAYSHAGVEPQLMGLGPIPAVKRVFERAGLKPADMDVIESNEAFAVQAMAVTRDLGLDPAKVNPNGGAVALGHPIGATGCILTVKAIYELHRTGKRYALVTMCIGGGQGIAAIFERM